MNKYDIKLDNASITKTLIDDSIDRNRKINIFLSLLSTINDNSIIAIDGKWGTGKTIFVKQIEYLNSISEETIPQNISKDFLNLYKNNYEVFYYNAWENDCHDDPILSLIFNLINKFPNEKDYTANGKIQLPFDLQELLKTISGNFFDISKIRSFKDIADKIYTTEEKKHALNVLIDNIVNENKRILIIIDELDRCKPDFAIKMLEAIKHYYKNERITFLVSCNIQQLTNTINKFYGNNFDGYGYLNKFFELIIKLEPIPTNEYIKFLLSRDQNSNYTDAVIFNTCKNLDFTMREINRFLTDYSMLQNYFSTTYANYHTEDYVVKFIFLPYCLGMKIKNYEDLDMFLDGKGFNKFKDFVMRDNKFKKILEHQLTTCDGIHEELTDKLLIDNLEKKYDNFFNNDNVDNYYLSEDKKRFFDILSLLSSHTKLNNNLQE